MLPIHIQDGYMYSMLIYYLVKQRVFPSTQKPFLSDEHRVDYVQVDEKKTQALQNTKMEWTDVRQSKT